MFVRTNQPVTAGEHRRALGVTEEDMFLLLWDCWAVLPRTLVIAGRVFFESDEQSALRNDSALRYVRNWRKARSQSNVRNRHLLLSLGELKKRYSLTEGQAYLLALNKDLPDVVPMYGRVHFPVEGLSGWERTKTTNQPWQRGQTCND